MLTHTCTCVRHTLFSCLRELVKLGLAGLLVGLGLRQTLVLGLGCLQLLVGGLKVSKASHATIQQVLVTTTTIGS